MSDTNILNFEHESIRCKIITPNEQQDYYLVIPDNESQKNSCKKINKYCIKKKPTIEKIKLKLIKEFSKNIPVDVKPNFNDTKTDTCIDEYQIRSKLSEIANSSKSMMSCKSDIVKNIFDKQMIIDVLISEYLDCVKQYKNNKMIHITLINDNIFSWNIKYKFKKCDLSNDLKKLKDTFGYDHVELDINFHDELYPNYPPMLKITKPVLESALSHRISNSKMTQLSYWTPSRTAKYLIDRIGGVLEKWGRVDMKSTSSFDTNNDVFELHKLLINFSSQVNNIVDDEIDSNGNFIKFDAKNTSNQPKQSNTNNSKSDSYWKKGTGYGHSSAPTWDINEYIKLNEKKKVDKLATLNEIYEMMNKNKTDTNIFIQMCKVMSSSLLMTYLIEQFKNSSILDMSNDESTFKSHLKLIKILSTQETMFIFSKKHDDKSLYDVMVNLVPVLNDTLIIDDSNMFFKCLLQNIDEIIKMYTKYDDSPDEKNDEVEENCPESTDVKIIYQKKMSELKFKYSPIIGTNFYPPYMSILEKSSSKNWKRCQKRLSAEIPSMNLNGQIPIDYGSSIFIRVDQNSPMLLRSLITGPVDTPYESGCMIFDIFTDDDYPVKSPSFTFVNHGGNRFNPNLYGNGKVCLSMLGTYIGPAPMESEKWNKNTSNLLQVLLSIQSQILIEEPYFNEPGHEQSSGSVSGIARSKNYNAEIRLYTMKSAMRDLLKNPEMYPQFTDVILNHFKIKKLDVIKTCAKWTEEAPSGSKEEYKKIRDEITSLLNNLPVD
jgi:ubiquitin-protein ligase